MPTLTSFPAERLSTARSAWAIVAATVGLGLGLVATTVLGAGVVESPLVIVPVALVTAFVAYTAPRASVFARREALELRIDDAGVWLGPRALLSNGDVTQGFVMPMPGERSWMVRLERLGLHGDQRLVVQQAEQGRAILEALGLGVDRRTASFRGLARFHALPPLARGLALAIPPVLQAALLLLMQQAETAAQLRAAKMAELVFLPLAIIFYLVVAATRTRIEVGSDGVLVRWLGRDRFYRRADIARVRAVDGLILTGVALELSDGRTVSLPVGTRRLDGGLSRELAARVEDARSHAARERTHGGQDALHRGGRPVAAWLTALRNVGAGANADMRTPTISLDNLAAVLLDPASPPMTRAAAAVAAVAADPLEGRARIRVAQASCANDKLKRALGAIVRIDSDDERIARALVTLDTSHA